MEEQIKETNNAEEVKDIFKLSKEELKQIFSEMSLSEIEDLIDVLNEVKNND